MSTPSSLPEPPHRRTTLLALLVATAFGAVLFGVLNIQRGAIALAVVELSMGVFATALIFVVRRTLHLRRWTLIYLVPFFSAMVFAMSTPLASPTVFIWIFLIPVISHLLLGRWLGLAMACVCLLAAGGVYLTRFGNVPELVDTVAIANVIFFSIVLLALSHAAEYTRERSERLLLERASSDALTGLANRSHLRTVYLRERERARRQSAPLSLLLLDLDHFKAVNDRYGHETGDAALVHVARLLRRRLRTTDLACRHGGEEFAALLPGTDRAAAAEVAEALRAELASTPLPGAETAITLSASFGIAQLGPDGDELDRLLARADERLFEAKRRGRNCVVADGSYPDAPWPQNEAFATDNAPHAAREA